MYDGDDRVEQVNWLRNVAANIAFSSDDPETSAEDRVAYFCQETELPEWFDAHDQNLLVTMVGD